MKASHSSQLAHRYRITDGRKFRLQDIDPADTSSIRKEDADDALERGVKLLSEMQEKLYAQDKWAVLLIFQAMDAAGKDGTIKHVMSGVNPQGCEVYSFKAPSAHELDHDFLWRCHQRVPERGRIGIFNRSYYEETLIVRVHPKFLEAQRLPQEFLTDDLWQQRFEDIRNFEQYLTRNGVVILKFFLHVSKEEQRRRFLSRLEEAEKHWKFSLTDTRERQYWNDYMHAYQEVVRHTATRDAPWYVVPADHKWFTRLTVAEAIIDKLQSLDLRFPTVDPAKRRELAAARRALQGEK